MGFDPLFRAFRAYHRDKIGFLRALAAEYGDVASLARWPYLVVLLCHPDDVRDVLVTHQQQFVQGPSIRWIKAVLGEGLLGSEGELHRRHRRMMQPAFHRRRIAGYAEAMGRRALHLAACWHDGETIDAARAMMELTLAIVAETLFGADVTGDARELGAAVSIVNAYMAERTVDPFAEIRHRLPFPETRRYRRAVRTLDTAIAALIQQRRATGDTGDLLSMLIAAAADGAMSDRHLRDEVLTLFLAGHETTANLLSWTMMLLAAHPAVAERLEEEVDCVLGDRTPTMDDLPRLRYAEMVLSESLRLYPPVWAMSRRALRDYHVGPYLLPAGSVVVVSPAVTHRDPRWYPDPDRFDPDRWLPEAVAARPKFSFFPFGGGSRQCLGEGFAWLEATIILATLVRRWRFLPVSELPPATEPLVTLRPKGRLLLAVRRRARPLGSAAYRAGDPENARSDAPLLAEAGSEPA
ncbi:MAG: cytochrome P450 [Chloroflexota bacterium]|nr:cytochrome P450 [Dehalococcoidia bacterium]MDW8253841.1 cytochrome P450 [Chloroflexota bacterium]